jgi:hypothetical protein
MIREFSRSHGGTGKRIWVDGASLRYSGTYGTAVGGLQRSRRSRCTEPNNKQNHPISALSKRKSTRVDFYKWLKTNKL